METISPYLPGIAAPKVLARAGLLDGKAATCFPGTLDPRDGTDGRGIQVETSPVVIDGKVVTSRGPGTAMDFALELITILAGPEVRATVEADLQRP